MLKNHPFRGLGLLLLLPLLLGAATAPDGIMLERIAGGFDRPVFVIGDPSAPNRLLVIELSGVVTLLVDGVPQKKPFLNIASRVGQGTNDDEEYGLFSLAFDPKWPKKRFIYVNYTDTNGNTVIARFTANKRRTQAKANTEVKLRTIIQPESWHNGGQLQVGPDKHLYVGMGDGGDQADSGKRGQDLSTLHGKMLRFQIAKKKLKIPKDNPSLPGVGRTAIWALGLRNPWRFSFDRMTGDLFIADVGESSREEVSYQAAGSAGGMNFGWPVREGSVPFSKTVKAATTPLINPVHEYGRGEGQSITGGYVYRGAAIPGLQGYYIYGDWAAGRIWAFKLKKGKAKGNMDLSKLLLNDDGETPHAASFGEDADGEIYVCDFFEGVIYKIVPAS